MNEAWNNFKIIFFEILDKVAPIKSVRIKNRTEPWMDSTILDLIRERDKILYKSNKNRNDKELRKKFNSLRNKVQHEIRKAKTNFFKIKLKKIRKTQKIFGNNLNLLGIVQNPKVSLKSYLILIITFAFILRKIQIT